MPRSTTICSFLVSIIMLGMPVQAGTLTFIPLDGTGIFPDPLTGLTQLRFQVGLLDDFETVGSEFTAAALHIGMNGGPKVDFAFGDLDFTLQSVDPSSVFDSAFLLNAVDFDDGASLPFNNIGIVTVDFTGAPIGVFELLVWGEIASSQNEAAYGSVVMAPFPEPATVSLLAFGAFALWFRRW